MRFLSLFLYGTALIVLAGVFMQPEIEGPKAFGWVMWAAFMVTVGAAVQRLEEKGEKR